MSNFKVGDRVHVMPCGSRGYVKKIDESATYPIVVYYTESPNLYEGSYTLDGSRYRDNSPENRRFYITKDVVASAQTTQPTTETSSYWSIIKTNSLFIYLTHPGQGDRIITIASITTIYPDRNSVTLATQFSNYDLGPIHFDEVANLLFAQQQSNSI